MTFLIARIARIARIPRLDQPITAGTHLYYFDSLEGGNGPRPDQLGNVPQFLSFANRRGFFRD